VSAVAVVTFPGSNCDADLRHAVALAGMEVRAVWHKDRELGKVDAVMLPGGFSYGDYLRCGAIARFSPIMEAVAAFAAGGGPVLGICNGFQILTECGLVPGVLLRNRALKFLCQDVVLTVEGKPTPFTRQVKGPIRLPIAHAEGNWYADPETLARVEGEGQVIFRYVGTPARRDGPAASLPLAESGAPNGALNHIAGVCNAAGNVVGLMPHPERYVEAGNGGTDGAAIFSALRGVLG
jgi:phosphoribosylformylglycinamidine synthase subunit PurQ / glutaminase